MRVFSRPEVGTDPTFDTFPGFCNFRRLRNTIKSVEKVKVNSVKFYGALRFRK